MKKHTEAIIIGGFVFLFIVCAYLEVFHGYNKLTFIDFIGLLQGNNTIQTEILEVIRIPRFIKAVIAGSCLAVAGMFLQTITKNPLVEPYFTGVSSGAGLTLVIAILLNVHPGYYSLMGFAGALLVSIIVIFLTGINKFSLVKLILVGLSVNIFVSSLISSLILYNSEKAHSLLMVLTGNINSSTSSLKLLVALFVFGLFLSVVMVPKLNFMMLDGSIIKAISKRANLYFVIMVILASFLASLSVSAAGIIGFVGILIPHLSRLIIGENFKYLFILNILLGSTIILFCDFIARNVMYPSEVPLGLVIAIIGAPIFLIFLIIRGKQFYA
jgi:iron complex transport system permease protein